MAIVKGRHIRHDWRTFNDRQDQKSVRTLCGVTSTPSKSGIPGVTPQKTWLIDSEKSEATWGWCWMCTRRIMGCEVEDLTHAPKEINLLYLLISEFVTEAAWGINVLVKSGESLYSTPSFKLKTANN
jgi:hypothetical protein